MERILVTGSEGRIGRVLVSALANEYEVFGLDIKPSRRKNTLRIDITNKSDLQAAFQKIAPRFVIHLAGNPNEYASWEEIYPPNILGTRNVYDCAKESEAKRVIFASSTHLIGYYPGYPQGPIENGRILTVGDPPRPDSDYGSSKGFGELVARQFFDLYQLESICIRIGAFRPEAIQDPNDLYRKISISARDLIQLVKKGLKADVPFGIYFGISNNTGTYLDISNAEKNLGYSPQDSF